MAEVYVHIFPNKKLYFGLTKNKSKQRWAYGRGYDSQTLVRKAIEKYGWENVQHIVLFSNITIEMAEECEKYLIKKYKTQDPDFGYNLCEGGNTNKGYCHTEEYKENLRQSMIGKYKGEKSPCYRKPLSEEQRKQISNTLKGHKQREETKRRKSDSLKGHAVSEETRRKISAGNKGKKRTEEQKERVRLANLGRKASEETKRKRSESLKGHLVSEETRRKISETQKRRRMQCLSGVS